MRKENELIRQFRSNDPAIGYNRHPTRHALNLVTANLIKMTPMQNERLEDSI
jgi:hypothetical protein